MSKVKIKIISGKRKGEIIEGKALSGVEAHFMHIDKEVGIKWFSYRDSRDHTVKGQRHGFKHNFAPPVFGKMKIRVISSEYERGDYTIPHEGREGYAYMTGVAERVGEDSASMELIDLMWEHGHCSDDTHPRNIGFYKGKEVMIDFGPMSS